jgi:hypothetical protein
VKYQDTIHAVVESLPKEVAPQILAMASMKRLEKEESFRLEKGSPERLQKQKSLRVKTERPSDSEMASGTGPTFSVEFPSMNSGDFGILRSSSSDGRPSMDTPQSSFRLTPNGVTSPRNVQNATNSPHAASPLADVEAFRRSYSKDGRSVLNP